MLRFCSTFSQVNSIFLVAVEVERTTPRAGVVFAAFVTLEEGERGRTGPAIISLMTGLELAVALSVGGEDVVGLANTSVDRVEKSEQKSLNKDSSENGLHRKRCWC